MIAEIDLDEMDMVGGGLTAGQTTVYILIGAAAVATGGSAAIVGGLFLAVVAAVA